MKDRNENRPGYKKTKSGWIPEDWGYQPAGKLFQIQLGKMLSQRSRNGINPKPYLANHNVRWGYFDLDEIREMDFSEKEIEKFVLKKGDLLVCEGGEAGRCAVWEEQIKPCLYQKALHRLRSKDEQISTSFAMYYLHRAVTSPIIVRFTGRTSISHLTREQFINFPIVLPPSREQNKIVKILYTWDRAIEGTRKLIDAKKRLKKALMQQLLTGKSRLPNNKTGNFIPTWQKAELREVFQRVQRASFSAIDAVLSITATIGFVHQRDKFSKVIAGKNLDRYTLLKKGEFAYNKGNSKAYPQGCVHLLEDYEKALVPNVYICFQPPNAEIDSRFYKYYFENGMLNHQLHRVINTGVRNDGLLNLNPHDFFKVKIHVPPAHEQRQISAILTEVDKEITILKKKLAALEKQKRGLMQKLLTGEVRVKV
ncbi:MAG: restriction endonuclease subunit S [Desulfobacterales bacterium]|nr:restriction endonuclease subunit S [Desulfobacterales bacterium]